MAWHSGASLQVGMAAQVPSLLHEIVAELGSFSRWFAAQLKVHVGESEYQPPSQLAPAVSPEAVGLRAGHFPSHVGCASQFAMEDSGGV